MKKRHNKMDKRRQEGYYVYPKKQERYKGMTEESIVVGGATGAESEPRDSTGAKIDLGVATDAEIQPGRATGAKIDHGKPLTRVRSEPQKEHI